MDRYILIFRSTLTGEWYFRILADNGETIAASEGYHNRTDLLDTLNRYFGEWEVREENGDEGVTS